MPIEGSPTTPAMGWTRTCRKCSWTAEGTRLRVDGAAAVHRKETGHVCWGPTYGRIGGSSRRTDRGDGGTEVSTQVGTHRHGREVHEDHDGVFQPGHRHGTVVLGPRRSPRRRHERFGPPAEPCGRPQSPAVRLETVLRWIVEDASVERDGDHTWMRVDPRLIGAAAELLEGRR